MTDVKIYTITSDDLSPPIKGEGFCTNMVRHSDYAALEAKCDQLAAEKAAMAAEVQVVKTMNDCLSEELREYESDGAFEGPKMHLLWWKAQTPTSDAWQREQMATGVERFAGVAETMLVKFANSNCSHIPEAVGWKLAGDYAKSFAAQLRNGEAV